MLFDQWLFRVGDGAVLISHSGTTQVDREFILILPGLLQSGKGGKSEHWLLKVSDQKLNIALLLTFHWPKQITASFDFMEAKNLRYHKRERTRNTWWTALLTNKTLGFIWDWQIISMKIKFRRDSRKLVRINTR